MFLISKYFLTWKQEKQEVKHIEAAYNLYKNIVFLQYVVFCWLELVLK